MHDARWRRLQELFHRASELDGERRDGFLAAECGDDESLRRQVLSLIAAADEEVDLARPVRAVAERMASEPSEAASPAGDSRVGPYRIVRELGRGGMGTVYLAERADGAFDQSVALKLIGPAIGGLIASPGTIDRFLEERQILAHLDHPGIARLLDGGATPEGVPYFAMEWVDGEPIHAWCDRQRLPLGRRLELFLEVCDAVAYAHRELVVHRDLKPSNILVTAKGRPKLLDFGIAKLLDPSGASPALTRLGDRPMTPEYASPEQVLGEPVSTASDVYGLGLLLFELLTGEKAHRIESGDATEIRRAVCEQPPTRPSLVASRGGRDAADARRSSPARLGKRLSGDLDTIVLTALRKEPERRYGSVDRLAEDVRRHLDGQPVRARGDGVGYRAGRFLRRHWVGTAATVLVLASLVGGLVATTLETRRAEREAARAEAALGFVVDLLETADPESARGREVTVREILDRAGDRIDNELAGQPLLAAELERVTGSLYRELGHLQSAEELTERAVRRLQRADEDSPVDLALARLELARLRLDQGRLAEAETEAESALALLRRDRATARLQSDAVALLGDTARRLGDDLERARELLRRALRLDSTVAGGDPETTAWLHNRLAHLEMEAADYDAAEAEFTAALASHRRSPAAGTLAEANTLHGYAWLLHRRERSAEGKELGMRALAIYRRDLGPMHLEIADMLSSLGSIHRRLQEFAQAEAAFAEAIEMARATGGEDHPLLSSIYNNLASLRFAQERYAEAAVAHERAMELLIQSYGPDHPWVGKARGSLAFDLHHAGDPRAEGEYRATLQQLSESRENPHHPDLVYVRHGLGRLLMESGRCDEARPLLDDALDDLLGHFGEAHPQTLRTRIGLAACLIQDGELDPAGRHLDAASARYLELGAGESWHMEEIDLFRGELLVRRGRRDEGLEVYETAATNLRAQKDPDHWLVRLADRVGRRLG